MGKNTAIIELKKKVQEKILTPLSKGLNSALELVHDFFIDIHGGIIKAWLHYTLLYIYKMVARPFWRNAALHRWLYIAVLILPRMIVTSAMLVEAVIFHKFDYAYKFLTLLLIPLLWKAAIYCLEKHAYTQKLFTTIFFEINVIRDQEEILRKCPGETGPVYEFVDREVSQETLSNYPFLRTEADYGDLRQNYVAFSTVETDFFNILSPSGPVSQQSKEYNYAMISLHLISLILWGYMLIKTIITLWF